MTKGTSSNHHCIAHEHESSREHNVHSCLRPGGSAGDLQELEVEGTSFNPGQGGVIGLTSLPPNLEVPQTRLRLSPSAACLPAQAWRLGASAATPSGPGGPLL